MKKEDIIGLGIGAILFGGITYLIAKGTKDSIKRSEEEMKEMEAKVAANKAAIQDYINSRPCPLNDTIMKASLDNSGLDSARRINASVVLREMQYKLAGLSNPDTYISAYENIITVCKYMSSENKETRDATVDYYFKLHQERLEEEKKRKEKQEEIDKLKRANDAEIKKIKQERDAALKQVEILEENKMDRLKLAADVFKTFGPYDHNGKEE